jgi:hypothetical protein
MVKRIKRKVEMKEFDEYIFKVTLDGHEFLYRNFFANNLEEAKKELKGFYRKKYKIELLDEEIELQYICKSENYHQKRYEQFKKEGLL